MKKIFYFILAAAAIVASCAKEPINEPVSPSGDGSSVFTGTIIQPGGIGEATKVSIIDQDDDSKVYVKWDQNDKIYIIKKNSGEEWNSTTESTKPKVFQAASSEATTEFTGTPPTDWIAPGAEYAARYYGNNDVWKEYVLAGEAVECIPINCNSYADAAFLENMPLSCEASTYDSGNFRYNFKFSNAYAILQINVPSKLEYKDLYVCVNVQNVEFESGNLKAGSKYTLCLKDADAVKLTDKYKNKDHVTYFVPVSAGNYAKLTIVAAKDDAEVARMETYVGNVKNTSDSPYVLPELESNNIYPFDFCNTKTISQSNTSTEPCELVSSNGIDFKVNVSADITGDVYITTPVEGKEPANIYLNLRGHKIDGNLYLNGQKSHVEGENGTIVSAEAQTSNSTFVVKPSLTITGLTVKKGSVKVEGTEDHKANVETITIPADAEGFINIDVTGVTAGDKKVVIDNQSTNGTVQLVKSTGSKYEIKEGSKPVAEIEGDVAQIGDKKYFSLAEAIADVKDGETVTLLKNVDQAFGISVPAGEKTFTVDFGGFTYKVEKPGAGSANTKTQAFQLNQGNTITFKNGIIECTEANKTATWNSDSQIKGVAMIIQNYANLTLDGMTIDATNIAHNGAATRYAISNNSGNVEFKGATSIISAAGDYAFDACKFGTYTKPIVTWNSTGSVNGVIELSGGDFIVAKDLKVSRPIRSNSNPSTLTVNSGVTVSPAAKFPAVETAFANANNEYKKFNEFTSGVVIVNRGGNLTINGEGTITSTANEYCYAAVSMTETGEAAEGDKAKLTIDGNVTLEGLYYGVVGNGQRHDTEITVKGGTVKGLAANDNAGIYHPQKGILTINGGTIEGATGIYVKSGDVTASFNAGTIKGVGTKTTYNPDREGDGFTSTGDAVVFDNCGYPGGAPNADIKGGTFTSTNANAIESYAKTGFDPITGFISGGTFNTQPAGDLIADGYKIKKVSDTEYTVSAIDANDVATINGFAYSDLATALKALKAGETLKIWKAGEYSVQKLSTPANTTVEGMAANRGVVFNHTAGYAEWVTSDATYGRTVKNITWNVGTSEFQYFRGVNLVNCKMNGLFCNSSNNTFLDCEFYNEKDYNLWEYGAGATFKNCKFTCPGGTQGGAVNAYNQGEQGLKKVVFENCEFLALNSSEKYAAVYIKPESSFDIEFTNCTFNDNFCTGDKSGSKLWNVKAHSNLNTKVTVDGKLEYEKGSLVGISTPDQLKAFATAVNGGNKYSGLTVNLYADIDLNNTAWTPIRSNAGGDSEGFTFKGNGHTVSNLKIETEEKAVGFFGNATNAKISNLTIDGATVTGINHVAVLVGNGLCTQIENCTVKNATVESKVKNNDDGDKAAAICGYLSAEPSASIKNCYVENVTVKAYRDLAAIAGFANGTAAPIVSGNTAKDVKVICNQANNYKNYTTNAEYHANQVVGENAANAMLDNNTCTNVTVEYVSGSVQQE